MHRDYALEELARRLARRDTQVRVPRQKTTTMRKAIIAAVDHSAFHCDIQVAGSLVTLPSISYVQPYHTGHQPQVGHNCWVQWNGNDCVILGHHVSAFGSIIP